MKAKTPLPSEVKRKHVEALTAEIASILTYGAVVEVDHFYDKCNLQPTPRPARLAAEAAVAVLLANEMGQRVGQTYMDGD